MAAFLASLRKDLRRFAADPGALLLWLGIPVVIGSLMSLAMGGSDGAPPTAHLLVVDEDETFLSEMLASAGEVGGGLVRVESRERAEAFAALDEGEASALVVLPDGFAQDLLTETPTVLEVVTNPAQRILPGILRELLELGAELAFYAHRLIGEPLREIAAGPPAGADLFPEADTARIAVEFQRRFETLGGRLFPPVLALEAAVEDEADGGEGPQVGLGALFFPGLVYMGLLFVGLGLSLDLWSERSMGTLRRSLVAPSGAGPFLLGKLAAGAVVLALLCAVGVALGVAAFGYRWGAFPAALAWSLFSGTAFLALFLWLQACSSSQRGGNLLASLVLFPLIMVGGSFFPFAAMPDWMAAVGRWTPNGLAVEELERILLERPPSGRLPWAVLVLAAAGTLAPLAAARRLRREGESA